MTITVETNQGWNQVILYCDIGEQLDQRELLYDVKWTTANNEEIKSEQIKEDHMPAKLYEVDWAGKYNLTGENVRCFQLPFSFSNHKMIKLQK